MHGFRAWLAMTLVSLHLHARLNHGKHADSNKDAGACASAFFRRIDVVSLILTARLLVACCDFWSRQPSLRRAAPLDAYATGKRALSSQFRVVTSSHSTREVVQGSDLAPCSGGPESKPAARAEGAWYQAFGR